ncbi:hypothetical protein CYMTET_4560 [Cymbomonas tetramitiformis]|uniref:Uncharacterized protein n=1 Tax=Cymbomonas tetramitiformis TaxID=36881 RepID=A0AAE0H143_9CHLO|nr:hypothetical protein CYMTET_4560 [Cymbomonas tetramitiformis]
MDRTDKAKVPQTPWPGLGASSVVGESSSEVKPGGLLTKVDSSVALTGLQQQELFAQQDMRMNELCAQQEARMNELYQMLRTLAPLAVVNQKTGLDTPGPGDESRVTSGAFTLFDAYVEGAPY